MDWGVFMERQLEEGAECAGDAGRNCIACFGEPEREYELLGRGPALVDRSYRGLLEISGDDRVRWLHNLTSQEVQNLRAGEGAYSFALNAGGRILFDLNILVLADVIRIDLDQRFVGLACKHFEKYVITEDVQIANLSDAFVRFGIVGDESKGLLSELGVAHAAVMPWLGTGELIHSGVAIPFFRHDFCGTFGVELLVPVDRAVEVWEALSDSSRTVRAVPVGYDAVQVRRIERGIPWPLHEITDDYLPAETGQLDRAVSFSKGCYLGQEVVERMRSRGGLARRLVGLVIEGDEGPPDGAALTTEDGARIGMLTSSCRSFAKGCVVGLGYVKTASAPDGSPLGVAWGDRSVDCRVVELPFCGA